MANHAQSTPRGLFAKAKIVVGSSNTAALTADSTGLVLSQGLKVSNKANAVLTGNSTGLVVSGGVKFSNKKYITANRTGLVFSSTGAIPTTDEGVSLTLLSNSTGVAVVVNTTATTWKYLNVTTKQPA